MCYDVKFGKEVLNVIENSATQSGGRMHQPNVGNSFSSLSYDKSIASSTATSPRGSIYRFLFQFPASSGFLKVNQ
jgi:hypothetical protein